MAVKTEKKQEVTTFNKKNFLQIINQRLNIDIDGEFEMYEEPIWDNTNGQKGVLKDMRMHIILRQKSGRELCFELGYDRNKNRMWTRKEKGTTQKVVKITF